tara:strand:- start:251 stop:427 length:177 start_codon:yes stop_codon:yes gene_type:complete
MILQKMLINAVAGLLVKQFKLDKIMDYVFKDNSLDKSNKELRKEVDSLKERVMLLENK